ncbi:Fur-regulated basic protein FbpA [Thermaerobacillus caldiproteolyticus]|uniref:Fur-regulated basic protein FbpA n=1 Tax=Thermaerobacillus caldiproteolyticus TaxID=247480 RepID=A0A7V9Z8L8_9BACL|nr:Fur-regulated basic protein FbpA [Anoxybacillus caldiproteolyticus]MBA2875971.1 hypothetical protein [Anoxybacillus caldiproteolyticus]QPA32395.1 Fur-regulated basic protein FbpA [Anoxybacillus caldiproteolyticus]
MGKLIRTAIIKQKQFYIYKLLKTGLFPDANALRQWTVSELRREYERYGLQQKKKRGNN